ncbi:MAG TPA: NAD(P)-dependent oxidoreductase [Gemmatimonadaceae bacterium]|nr:NAD(P)-dependent oxidoreductase [Gemmatimonadaceae bacterium]
MSIVPIGVRAESLTVVVVGGGEVGARKAGAFLDAGARVRVVDPRVSDDLRNRATPSLELIEREFTESDVEAGEIVIAATGDAAVNARVADACRSRKRLCNRADDPADGSFETLAIHRSGPLTIGVSAGGVPGAASRIRDEIGKRFDSRYGEAIETILRLRASRRTAGDWPRVADVVLAQDFCDAVEAGAISGRVSQWD